jgi:hypothetical protein
MKTTRCIICSAEFTDEEIIGTSCCPSCKTTSLPLGIIRDILLPINWSEIRLLANWACRWSDSTDMPSDSRAALQAVLKRITKHRPPNSPALTLAGEVKELGAELIGSDGEVIIPRPES